MKKTTKRLLSLALAMLTLLLLLSATSCDFLDIDFDGLDFDFLTPEEPEVELSSEQIEFAGSIGGVSETFKGVMSEESFRSPEEAAIAYVNFELAGDGNLNVSILSSKTLRASKIKKLDIPEEFLEGYEDVVEVELEYSEEDSSSYTMRTSYTATSTEKLDRTKTVKVYVIKYAYDWKYFSPCPVTGDTISRSYYDSVFNSEKYENCTFEVHTEAVADVITNGETVTMDMVMNQIVKHADGKVYLEQYVKMVSDEYSSEQTVYAYMETNAYGEIECYVKTSEYDSWMPTDLSTVGFTSLEQLTPFYDQYLDYTYFTKTDYGFALEDENARKYFEAALMGTFSGLGMNIDTNNMDLDMYAEYYVSEGVLSGMRVDADVDMTVNEGYNTASLKERVTTVTTCTDYGTTVVERPFAY